MLTNIRGLVNTLELGHAHGMIPLYEAVSNAIDAIGDSGKGVSAGLISIRLKRKADLAKHGDDYLQPIDGFSVEDNGIGFAPTHFDSFKEAYTLMKIKVGGKGVGRFTYLKAFDNVAINSMFDDGGQRYRRQFKFSIDREVYDESPLEILDGTVPTGTTVSVDSMADRYLSSWPRDAETIGQRIIAHFLVRFAARSCPPISLHDEGAEPIDLHKLFNETIQPHIQEIQVNVRQHQFSLQVFRHMGSREKHEIHYCASGREVIKSRLKDLLPELPERFLDDEKRPYTLKVLLTGEYLDNNANTERTEIIFNPDQTDLATDDVRITRAELEREISSALRQMLVPDLKTTNEEKLQDITKFVQKAPEYQVLLNEKYRTKLEQKIPPGCTEEKLDEHLLKLRREIEDDVRREEQEIATLVDKVSFDQYQVKMNALIEEMNEVGKSQLASYIAHRRTILDLFDLSLKKSRTDSKYKLEEVLHNMVFPMGKTSKDIFQKQQNLWIIDERLCFHTILTSDKKLKSIPGLENTSGKEPDIFSFFYDTPIGLQEADDSSGAIVIIEFKRPGRDDYKTDPAQQVIQRFVEIKNGNVQDIDGRRINPTGLRFFGYLIADLTPSLKFQMEMNYHPSIDGEGYFKTLTGGNGYIEILSYDKLLADAKRRNRVLFEKLGLHKN